MKVSNNFILQEFIDPDIWAIKGAKSIELIDHRIIDIAQAIRDHFGVPMTINNWEEGGKFEESGLRKFLTKTGAVFSQHKYGRAIDFRIEGVDPEEARKEIIRYWQKFSSLGASTLESNTPTWVHIDCRNTLAKGVNIVAYNGKV